MTASIHLRVSVGEKKGTREAERNKERKAEGKMLKESPVRSKREIRVFSPKV